MHLKKIIVLCIAILVMASFIQIPSTHAADNKKRPKIGLVLGGGGARGIAHIGVLKVLEENRVPVDYVVGTSMGAIIGGLYASGYSADEIDELNRELDWMEQLNDTPTDDLKPFRNKGENTRLVKLKIGLKDKNISLPQGVVQGQTLGMTLKEKTLHVHTVKHFDDLNIPFRCNAVDLETGTEHIFESGNLADAMRASMSVPGAFAPVEVDGKLLVDGMVLKNVAIDIAKDMGADIIIAVDVGIPLQSKENLNSFMDIFNQFMNIMFIQSIAPQLALLTEDDILIQPDLGQISPGDFASNLEIYELGLKTAHEHVDSIKRYSLSEDDYAEYLKKQRRSPDSYKKPVIDYVDVQSSRPRDEKRVRDRIKAELNAPLDMKQLHDDIKRLHALGYLKKADFLLTSKKDKTGLLVRTEDKTWDKNYMRFGLNLDDDFDGNANYKFILDYTQTNINRLGAEWETAGVIGNAQGILTEFYQPLDLDNTSFVSIYGQALRQNMGIYGGRERTGKYRATDLLAQVDIGLNYGTHAQIKIGINRGLQDRKPVWADRTKNSIDKAAIVAHAEYSTVDDYNFPHTGTLLKSTLTIEQEALGAEESYNRLDLAATKALHYKGHTLLGTVRGGTYIGNDSQTYDNFTLGGFLNLSGYGANQLAGNHSALGRLIYYYKVAAIPLGRGVYIGGSLEYGNVWMDRSDVDLGDALFAGSAFVGVDTILGPLYLGYGLGEGKSDDGEVYIFLGQQF